MKHCNEFVWLAGTKKYYVIDSQFIKHSLITMSLKQIKYLFIYFYFLQIWKTKIDKYMYMYVQKLMDSEHIEIIL